MARVKGTIILDFVKTIKADKSGAYDGFLNEEDWKVINQRVLPSNWYPYETFERLFGAVVKVLAGGDMHTVRQWGRIYGEAIVTGVYRGIIKEGEPMESLRKYGTYIRNLFDTGELVIQPITANEAVLTARGFDPNFEPHYHMMMGWIERSLELCGAQDIKMDFVSKSWLGDKETKFSVRWRELPAFVPPTKGMVKEKG